MDGPPTDDDVNDDDGDVLSKARMKRHAGRACVRKMSARVPAKQTEQNLMMMDG
jgi:hypothetical protein